MKKFYSSFKFIKQCGIKFLLFFLCKIKYYKNILYKKVKKIIDIKYDVEAHLSAHKCYNVGQKQI